MRVSRIDNSDPLSPIKERGGDGQVWPYLNRSIKGLGLCPQPISIGNQKSLLVFAMKNNRHKKIQALTVLGFSGASDRDGVTRTPHLEPHEKPLRDKHGLRYHPGFYQRNLPEKYRKSLAQAYALTHKTLLSTRRIEPDTRFLASQMRNPGCQRFMLDAFADLFALQKPHDRLVHHQVGRTLS